MEAQRGKILARVLRQSLGEAQPVLVDGFGGQGRQHSAQVAGQRVLRQRLDLGFGLPEEPLDRVVEDPLGLGGNLHVGDRLDVEGDVPLGEGIAHQDLDGDGLEVHVVDRLDDRHPEDASAGDGAVSDLLTVRQQAVPACQHGGPVGRSDDDQTLDGRDQHDDHDDKYDARYQGH